jgi:heme/copper-type cytochrome/quinol oxidase subunit 2
MLIWPILWFLGLVAILILLVVVFASVNTLFRHKNKRHANPGVLRYRIEYYIALAWALMFLVGGSIAIWNIWHWMSELRNIGGTAP